MRNSRISFPRTRVNRSVKSAGASLKTLVKTLVKTLARRAARSGQLKAPEGAPHFCYSPYLLFKQSLEGDKNYAANRCSPVFVRLV
jgi:hypothetical protein